MKKLSMVLFFSIVLISNITSQEVPKFITDSLDIYVNHALAQWKIPGAAVLIINDDNVIVSKGYGVKIINTEEKVDENTLFLIGSNTKAFTGTALAMLEYKNELKLQDKVVKFLPNFKMQNPLITKEINLIDIVTHRMGFETFQGDFMYWTSDLNEDNVIEKFSQSIPKYDFRTKYGYTNAGYAIAGKVIEKVSGLRWEDYIKENIFLPLKMDRTTALSVDFAKSDNVANPHTLVNGEVKILPFENIDNLAPCGSIGSSLNDLTNWLIVQLDSGRIEGINVIPYEVIEKTRTPHTIIRRGRHPFNKSHFSLYGLGWVLEDYEGTEIISHTGGVNGFVTSVTLIPEKKLGIVVLTNTDQNAFFQAIKWEIIDSYLGLPFRNYNDYMFEREIKQNEIRVKNIKEWKDSVSMKLYPDLKINEFIGNYLHEVYGYANISLKENYLELKLQHHSNLSGKLEYIGNNRFLCTYSDPMYGIKVFPFKIENEKVISFDLYVDDFIDFMPYKFLKQ